MNKERTTKKRRRGTAAKHGGEVQDLPPEILDAVTQTIEGIVELHQHARTDCQEGRLPRWRPLPDSAQRGLFAAVHWLKQQMKVREAKIARLQEEVACLRGTLDSIEMVTGLRTTKPRLPLTNKSGHEPEEG